jgi:hypothetical protein
MEKGTIVKVIEQEAVERRNRALILRNPCGFIHRSLSPPANVSSICFVNPFSTLSVTATSKLLVCIISSDVHDSLPPIGGESNSGSTRRCRWETESLGRTTTIESFVFGIGIGSEITVKHSEWWAGWCR